MQIRCQLSCITSLTLTHLAVRFMSFMSSSSSRYFSRTSLMVSPRVFRRTMRLLMRRTLSRLCVVTCGDGW